MNVKEINYEDVEWIQLTQVPVNGEMDIRIT